MCHKDTIVFYMIRTCHLTTCVQCPEINPNINLKYFWLSILSCLDLLLKIVIKVLDYLISLINVFLILFLGFFDFCKISTDVIQREVQTLQSQPLHLHFQGNLLLCFTKFCLATYSRIIG